jgi:hypothetical protein
MLCISARWPCLLGRGFVCYLDLFLFCIFYLTDQVIGLLLAGWRSSIPRITMLPTEEYLAELEKAETRRRRAKGIPGDDDDHGDDMAANNNNNNADDTPQVRGRQHCTHPRAPTTLYARGFCVRAAMECSLLVQACSSALVRAIYR